MLYKKIIFTLLIVFAFTQLKAQYVAVGSFEVQSSYLQDGKILISNSAPTTTIKIDVVYIKNQGSGSIKTRLVTPNQAGNGLVGLTTISAAITAADFGTNVGAITKTYEVTITKSSLTGKPIYLGMTGNLTNNQEGLFNNGNVAYNYIIPPVVPPLSSSITITSVSKVETILFGTDCELPHANGDATFPMGRMETDIWKFAFNVNYNNSSSSVSDSDIYWEWSVQDNSTYYPTQKQFLVYPYSATKTTPLDGNRKVTIESNDLLDEYNSSITLYAKSRTSGARLSADYVFNVAAVNH